MEGAQNFGNSLFVAAGASVAADCDSDISVGSRRWIRVNEERFSVKLKAASLAAPFKPYSKTPYASCTAISSNEFLSRSSTGVGLPDSNGRREISCTILTPSIIFT